MGTAVVVAGSVFGIHKLNQAQAAAPTYTYFGRVSMGPQAMEGNPNNVVNGNVLKAGYDFHTSDNRAAATVTFYFPPGPPDAFDFRYTCNSGPGSGDVYVEPPNQAYTTPAKDSADWFPSGNQSSSSVYQGSTRLATTCGSKTINLSKGGTFTACITEKTTESAADHLFVRWHYSVLGSAGGWSNTATVALSKTSYANSC